MVIDLRKFLSLLILLVSFVSTNQWSSFPLGSTVLIWLIDILLLSFVIFFAIRYFRPGNKRDYMIFKIYFAWMIAGVIRGMIVADNYWEWKQLVTGLLALALPAFVYVFYSPSFSSTVLRFWMRFGLLGFGVLIFVVAPGAYHFYLGPVLLLSCFLPELSIRWRFLLFGLLLLMVSADFSARSQVIKAALSTLLATGIFMRRYLSLSQWNRMVRIALWFFYITPIVLVVIGLLGQFNIFEDIASHKGRYFERKFVDGELVKEDLSSDTRTFIYAEVFTSALKHGYVLWGRTPARGNDSVAFGDFTAEELKTGKYERHSNEVGFLNVFTWLGLVGVTLYCFIYLRASWLAVYRSRNQFMRVIGLFIAFHFLFGWIEDFNRFDIMNISIWVAIAMGFSEKFRMMDNFQFKSWLRTIFSAGGRATPKVVLGYDY